MSGKSDEKVRTFAGSSRHPARSQNTPAFSSQHLVSSAARTRPARALNSSDSSARSVSFEAVGVDRVHHDVFPGERVERRYTRRVGPVRGVGVEEAFHPHP